MAPYEAPKKETSMIPAKGIYARNINARFVKSNICCCPFIAHSVVVGCFFAQFIGFKIISLARCDIIIKNTISHLFTEIFQLMCRLCPCELFIVHCPLSCRPFQHVAGKGGGDNHNC